MLLLIRLLDLALVGLAAPPATCFDAPMRLPVAPGLLFLALFPGCAAPDSPFPSPGEDLRAFPAALAEDGARTFANRGNWEVLLLGGSAAYLSEREPFEGHLSDFQERGSRIDGQLNSVLRAAGLGATLFLGSGLLYGWGRLREDESAYRSSKLLMRALSLTGLSTLAIKVAAGDGRPDGSDAYGFPSGHASMSMAFAVGIQRSYGWGWGLPAYLLSGAIGLQRFDSRRHDADDVIFGWTLGFVVARSIFDAASAGPEGPGEALQLGPYFDPRSGAAGLALEWSF